ncbi:MAG: FeoB small GTPase domain-containing protein, partial [Halobacteriales archaeon]
MSAPATVLLMGHPNVGKSALFNRLADADITESNYPGTTVDYTESEHSNDRTTTSVLDLPG